MKDSATRNMAISATLHCLTGCAIGEVGGMILSTAFSWGSVASFGLSIGLAFVFGYGLSILPLLRAGLTFGTAFPVILAADTLSIFTMEVVDNAFIAVVPGAIHATLSSWLFWLSLAGSLAVAFVAAVPVNYYLLRRGKGHALVHKYHHAEHNADQTEHHGHR